MAKTLPILEQIRARIYDTVPHYEVELFPDDPDNYRLNAQDGAILIQYLGSQYGQSESTSLVQQRRNIHLALTVLSRSQHNEYGSLETLDLVRDAVMGYTPEECAPCFLIKEEWLGSDAGIWQYQLIVATYAHEIQHHESKDTAKFVETLLRHNI